MYSTYVKQNKTVQYQVCNKVVFNFKVRYSFTTQVK